MMMVFHFLPRQDLITRNAVDVANVMVRTNEERMAWIVKEFANFRQLAFIGMLTRTLRIEADDNEYVDAVENFAVEKRYFAVGRTALDNSYDVARADRPGRDRRARSPRRPPAPPRRHGRRTADRRGGAREPPGGLPARERTARGSGRRSPSSRRSWGSRR